MEIFLFISIFIIFVLAFTMEVITPASKNTCDRRWLILASALSLLQIGGTLLAGWLFTDTFKSIALTNLSSYNFILQGLAGFFLSSFVAYWWHRAMHANDLLWRIFHQLHHSPKRIESLSAFYMHPFDGMAATLLNGLCCYTILGMSVHGTAVSLLLAAAYNIYIHADLKTPHWPGYILQRPEMHRVHHKYMHHDQNFGLAIWDLLFKTYSNPREYVTEVGFDKARSARVYDMLKNIDVYKSKPAA